MKRYIVTIVFSCVLILLYHFVPINLFALDFPQRITNNLFNYFSPNHHGDERVVMCNVGKLSLEETTSKIDKLLKYNPKIIGINICDFTYKNHQLLKHLDRDDRVILSACNQTEKAGLGRIINDDNIVTHFNSSNHDCFENLLSDNRKSIDERGNALERINYVSPFRSYYQFELKDIESYEQENFEGKIVLVGYIGDYVTEEVYNHKNCRITPLNQYYGHEYLLPDMYDIQISASIISMINNEEYINEINPFLRVMIILIFCLLNVGFITLIQTRWLALNLFFYLMIFIVLLVAGSLLIVMLFSNHFYLELNELTLVLIITSIFTVASNIKLKKTSDQ